MSISLPKILCLFSAPLATEKGDPIDALDVEAERTAIIRELAACNRQIVLRIGCATVDELARGIRDGFNILHFSGHGSKECLAFEDGKGGCQPIKGDYLKKLIGAGGPFELAIVSACHSEPTARMIQKAGVRHVVAIKRNTTIFDRAATAFAGPFYRHLFSEDSVQQAFGMAKLLVEGDSELAKMKPLLEFEALIKKESFIPEEKKFILLPTGDPSFHQKPIFKDVPQGVLSIEETRRSKTNIPVRPQSFRGRSSEIWQIINELLENRLVTITGAGGIGKTKIAVEVARWFSVRGHFPDGVFLLNLQEATVASRIMDLIGTCVDKQLAEVKDVIECLRDRHLLLLLDNAEDVLWNDEREAQNLINEILRFVPNAKILLTSQRAVGGNLYEPERVCRIGILDREISALLFFIMAKRPIRKDEWESSEFSDLLGRMGGHPLSIVLMARQLTNGVTIEELVQRIEKSKAKAIAVRGITDRDLEHGKSLVATLTSAYNSLSESAKTLFSVLSMLPAGAQKFTLVGILGDSAWEHAQELNDASLVEIRLERVIQLPPVRLFAATMLTNEIREQYGPKIMELMAAYASQFYRNMGSKEAREYRFYFMLEEPNLRFALELPCTYVTEKSKVSALGALSSCLILLYTLCHRLKEAKELQDFVISRLEKLQDQLGLANTLKSLGDLAVRTDDLREAKTRFDDALKIFQEIDAKLGQANTLISFGMLSTLTDKLDDADKYASKALAIYEKIDDLEGKADYHMTKALIISKRHKDEKAKHELSQCASIREKVLAHGTAAQWLILYTDHLKKAGSIESAKTFLEYAENFASKAKDQSLQNQIKQRINTLSQ